ncbi:MAG: hypothetical protein LBH58_07805, partial [Tannerellaceae bacterium]|nr:hypothetical protein [Tannerellaceae bacterium]
MNLLKSHTHTPVRGRTLLIALSLATIGVCLLVLLPSIRSALIAFGEMLVRRPLNAEHWQQVLLSMAFAGMFVSVSLLFIVSKRFEIISEAFPTEKL